MDKLHTELSSLYHLTGLTGDELGLVQQAVLLQLQLHQPRRHAGGVDGGVDAPQEIGDGADVVLVAVGEEDAPNLVLVFDEIGKVGDNHVDAVHVVVREAHAHVHHDDVPAVLVYGEVLADLVETAKRNDLQFFCHKSNLTLLILLYQNGWYVDIGAQQSTDVSPPRFPALPRRKAGWRSAMLRSMSNFALYISA